MRNALLVVDVQADFVQGGSLPVPNGMPVAAMIARHIRHFKTEYQFVVASRDYHEDPSDHFSNTPDFLVTWPPHCVIGTPGAAFVPPIANLVREKLIQCVVSQGRHIAADYCVRSTALDARKNAFQVRLLVNLCAAVNEATGLQALEELKAAGCQVQAATAP